MDWKDIYCGLKEKGYALALPTSSERGKFREQIEKQNNIGYSDARVRVIYVSGNSEKKNGDFFNNAGLTDRLNKDAMELIRKIKREDPSFQYCGYLYKKCPTPAEIVGRKLVVGQQNIEFIDPKHYEEYMGVFVTWRDACKKQH